MNLRSTANRACRAAAFGSVLLLTAAASGSVVINLEFGALRDSAGTVLASTPTLWAIVYDENGDGLLPGDLGTDDSLTPADAGSAFAAFAGATIETGTVIAGDRIIAAGTSDDPYGLGVASTALEDLDLEAAGLTPGRNYAFFWFPGRTTATNQLPADEPFQVGGLNEITNYLNAGDPACLGTQIPQDGWVIYTGILDPTLGGAIPTARLTAITAEEAADDFAAWIDGFFPGETDPAIVGFNADPDHDGVTNGTESALGTAPNARTSALTGPLASPGSLAFATTLAKDLPSDVTRAWQWSRNLVDWHADGASDGSITVSFDVQVTDDSDPLLDAVQVTATAAGGTPPRLFARLVATQATP